MYKNHKVSLILPCLDEKRGLKTLLPLVPDFIDEVLVVDNGSEDGSAEIARQYGARVIFEKSRGYGSVYQKGFREAKGDVFVTMDADATYPIEEAERIVDKLIDQDLNFVTCSRFPLKNPKAMHLVNLFGNWFLTFETNLLFGLGLKDSQSGMWVFKKKILEQVHPRDLGMPFSEEFKIRAFLHQPNKAKEIHINYHPRSGNAKLKPFRDGFKNFKFLIRLKRKFL